MIVNAFALCGSAEHTDINSMHIQHAGVVSLRVPAENTNPEWVAFNLNGIALVARQDGDSAHPILTLRLRDGEGYDARQTVIVDRWLPAPTGMELAHITFPVQMKVPKFGEYLLTAHTETSGDLAVALYPLAIGPE